MTSFHLNAWPLGELGTIKFDFSFGNIFQIYLTENRNPFHHVTNTAECNISKKILCIFISVHFQKS